MAIEVNRRYLVTRLIRLKKGSGDSPNRHLLIPSRFLKADSVLAISALFAVAIASRTISGFLLPNAEQDGYSYAEDIGRLTKQLDAGQFHISDLYGFWLPGFQAAGALVNCAVHDPLVAGKIVNVLCGAISIVLVFLITRAVTRSVLFSILTFGLMLLNPLHILYSASCMTDVAHTCFVLASLWFAVRQKWLGAALFAAIAGSIRIESWALIPALPLLQWLRERRVSWPVYLVLLMPPLGWFGLAFAATGSPFAYFVERARYHAEYIEFHPNRAGFDMPTIEKDFGALLLGAGKVVSAGAVLGAVVAVIRAIRNRQIVEERLLAPTIYGGAILALLVLAYVTKSQPVWLPRYGLIFFGIGLPLFAVALQWILSLAQARSTRTAIFSGLVAACLLEMGLQQSPILGKVRADFRAHRQIAAALVSSARTEPAGARCFSDDVAVRVLSGLPRERFLRTPFVPPSAKTSASSFVDWLHERDCAWLVFFPTEDSIPVKWFPELDRSDQRNDEFESIASAKSPFGPDIWLYRVR